MKKRLEKVVIIGAGNVATHIGQAIKDAGREVLQVYSRSPQPAQKLGRLLDCSYTNTFDQLAPDADLYLMAVSDDAIEELATKFPFKWALLVHTSGSTSIEKLNNAGKRTGVFYPLQTFSKDLGMDFSSVPVCLEARYEEDLILLKDLAAALSKKVYIINSEDRLILHVAAVFVCNFTNHMYTLGADVLKSRELPFEMLRPLILETARKAMLISPFEIQTGPAIRNDRKTLEAHNQMLEGHHDLKNLYNFITQSIITRHEPENK